MKKLIPLMATLLIVGVCFTWTARSFEDDKRRDGDKPREGQRDKPREGERERARDGDRERDGQARELEEWLEQREKQINSLRKQGKIDQAEALAQRTRKELDQHRRAMANRNRGDRDERAHREHGEHGHGDGGDNEEFGKWVNQQKRRIAELRKAGKEEEATKVLKHVQDAIAKIRGQGEGRAREREHGKREQDPKVRKFLEQSERKIKELRKQGKHEEAEKLLRHVKAKMAELHEHGEREHGEREHGEHGEREHGEHEGDGDNKARMKHIGAAIEHLQAAGLKDWAEELAAHAREMRGERGHRHEREDWEEPGHRHEGHERGEDAEGGVDQLRRELNELRNALREIQKHLEKRR